MKAEFQAQGVQPYTASLTVSGLPHSTSEPCVLYFSLSHPFDPESLEGGEFVSREGDLHGIRLLADSDGSATIKFQGEGEIKKASDYPYGLYIRQGAQVYDVSLPRPLNYERFVEPVPTSSSPCFLPIPTLVVKKSIQTMPESVSWTSDGPAWNVKWLNRLLARMDRAISESSAHNAWAVVARHEPSLSESFELDIHERGADVFFRDAKGFHIAQAYLFQFIVQWAERKSLSLCRLSGSPKFAYRGVHLDVVRHFFPATDILQWWDVIALFHFNHFHWHLTDDDGWRLESASFPQLTEVGAWRGIEHALPPQMGSGASTHGGFYTTEEAAEVVEQLDEMGVTVVPELDLPGHARALLKSLPALVESGDTSTYTSVQFHSDNVVTPAYSAAMDVVHSLVDEWCEVFPGALFHIGCDEVPEGVWRGSPAALKWAEAEGQSADELFAWFIQRLEVQLTSNGRTVAGWEEVTAGAGPATWVYSWQGVEAGQIAAEKGHPVVMAPAEYCYFDLAVTPAFEDPGYWWAGTVNLEKVYSYDPLLGLSDSAAAQIQGVQYCLWTELVENRLHAEFMWFPRLLAGAQVVWGDNTNKSYGAFVDSAKTWSAVLNRLGLHVRSEKMGW